jgi:hypothetical protein
MRVRATREGLLGQKTATGDTLDRKRPTVALPSVQALDRIVMVSNPLNGKRCPALVDDVGPFNTDDDAYVFGGARPLAESGISVSGKGTNGAGIDLGEVVWAALGMEDNTEVEWDFIL